MIGQFGTYVESMQRFGARAHSSGLQSGNGGNLSVRVAGTDTMLIKAKGGSLADLREDDIVQIDFDGEVLAGSSPPSREFRSHALFYRRRPDVGAVFHSHSPWSIASAARFDAIPCVSLHMEMKLGAIPVLASQGHADGKMVEELDAFLAVHIGVKAFIQKRHGIFSLSADIGEAEMQAELVEECAKIAMIESMAGIRL
jgi:L-fuculose-phosphate aldolase/L-ribulose-5-phosphate 4-epimerase